MSGHAILGGAWDKILLYIPDVCTHLCNGSWRRTTCIYKNC